MKGIVCALLLTAVTSAACGGDDGDMPASDASVQGGIDEPANLVGITLAHNQVRAMVDTSGIAAGPLPPMQWDPVLADHAKAWAEMCIDNEAPSGLVDHSSNAYRSNVGGFAYVGENIFASGSAPASATQAVQVWADEKQNFTYPSSCAGVCGHYTQVVWRTSVKLGCANVTCSGLQYKGVVLCEYGPGGNGAGAPY